MLSRIIHEDGVINERTRSYTPQSSSLRDAIMENAAGLVPATEGEQKFYAGVDKASIEKGREWAAGRNTTYTDCIDFAARRLGAGLLKVGSKATVPSPVFPDASKAFVKAYKGMPPDLRPSPGDIFVMHSGKPKDATTDSGDFAHTGVIKEVRTPAGTARSNGPRTTAGRERRRSSSTSRSRAPTPRRRTCTAGRCSTAGSTPTWCEPCRSRPARTFVDAVESGAAPR